METSATGAEGDEDGSCPAGSEAYGVEVGAVGTDAVWEGGVERDNCEELDPSGDTCATVLSRPGASTTTGDCAAGD
jgi:hypothetical protein